MPHPWTFWFGLAMITLSLGYGMGFLDGGIEGEPGFWTPLFFFFLFVGGVASMAYGLGWRN